MSEYTIGVVGTGPNPDESSHDGFSMGYRHARAFDSVEGCRLVACADVVSDHARDFGAAFDLPDDGVFTDLESMLDTASPDVVSICTPPSTHVDLVEACVDHDAVRAVHCEKPLAPTMGESRRLVELGAGDDVQLTINLQNRCSDGAAAIKSAIDGGEIGDLERVEIGRQDLLQTGLHHLDLANYVLGDEPVEWIVGQIDYPDEHIWYTDMPAEVQGLGMWEYESGVHGLCSTGAGASAVGPQTNRFLGTEGAIEFQLGDEYRIRTPTTGGWTTVEVGGASAQTAAAEVVVRSLETGTEPIIGADRALGATELVFGIWESARRRGRVEPPLEIEDNPLRALIESGELPPSRDE
ncbi:Gfo/Idh/MocA family protein [Natrononativus amylolyticus]|uniref:Gfo/Idh/MocA family protein n=1 Tax=Natrononativus amylolyticus TaxID=2963434 RepID=UPI0020CC5868|nr:Gfo/Idh/MocA family oxidoreductase [Natrononativus amylolyticus]